LSILKNIQTRTVENDVKTRMAETAAFVRKKFANKKVISKTGAKALAKCFEHIP